MGERRARRVMLVGWDAGDWKWIHPLLDSGGMPHLKAMIERGVMGNLASLHPVLSPMLWTSIATGKRADQHGIHGFTEPRPDGKGVRPVSSTSRRCKALWNILTQAGMTSHTVGWWASQPAEPVNGVILTDSWYQQVGTTAKPLEMPSDALHPPRLREVMDELRVRPDEIGGPELSLLATKPHGAIELGGKAVARKIGHLQNVLAHGASVHNAATWLLENEPCDLAAFYYIGIDHLCHGFSHFNPPRMPGVDELEFEVFKNVVSNGYRMHDLMLGRLIELAGDDTLVILISDHGFHGDHLRPKAIPQAPAGPAHQHRFHGIFAMAGPGVRQDERIYGATLLDITPTILHALGLPIGDDMAGKVLVDAFEDPGEVERIPSWETAEGEAGMHPADLQQDPFEADQALRQLIELGYIEDPGANAEKAMGTARRESKFNLAIAQTDCGRNVEAAALLEPLVAEMPNDARYAVALARCYLALGRYADARPLVRAFTRGGHGKPLAHLVLGSVLSAEGNVEGALRQFEHAATLDRRMPMLNSRIGWACIRLRRYAEAEAAFQRELSLDPDCPDAHHGLARIYLRLRRTDEALEHALTAVGLQHYRAGAHLDLALALVRAGQTERARHGLEICLKVRPDDWRVHRRLAWVCRRLGDTAAARTHADQAQALRERKAG